MQIAEPAAKFNYNKIVSVYSSRLKAMEPYRGSEAVHLFVFS